MFRYVQRRLQRKFSITAPRLSVRPHVPWYVRWSITLPFVLAAGWMVWWAYDTGLELAGFHRSIAEKELDELHRRLNGLERDRQQLTAQVNDYQRQAQIDHAAAQETARQLQALNEENLHLQEDLDFFQNLPLTTSAPTGLAIHRLKLERGAQPGEFLCRGLLVQNVQRSRNAFQGRWEIVVAYERAGQKASLMLPVDKSPVQAVNTLNFKFYQRIQHAFVLPVEAKLLSAELRVYAQDGKEVKIKQLIDYK